MIIRQLLVDIALTAAGFNDGDFGGAKGTIVRRVADGFRVVAAKKRRAKIQLLFGAVNQHPNPDYYTFALFHGSDDFTDGTAGREDVIHYKNPVFRINRGAAFEGKGFIFGFFRVNCADTHLTGNLKGKG
jgi:hypothetical protein